MKNQTKPIGDYFKLTVDRNEQWAKNAAARLKLYGYEGVRVTTEPGGRFNLVLPVQAGRSAEGQASELRVFVPDLKFTHVPA